MEQQSSVVEIWTVSRRGLVLAGHPDEIEAIATVLRLPDDAADRVAPERAELVLWGEILETYTRTRMHGAGATGDPAYAPPAEDGLTGESLAPVFKRWDD